MRRLLAIIAVAAVVGSVVYFLDDEKIKVKNDELVADTSISGDINGEISNNEQEKVESGENEVENDKEIEENPEIEAELSQDSEEKINEEHEFISQKMLEYNDENNFYAINNDIVSFVNISYYDGNPQYTVVNLNRYSGMEVTNQELLIANNINIANIDVKKIYEDTFMSEYVSAELIDGLRNNQELPETNKYNNEIVLNLYRNLNAYEPINIEDVEIYIDKEAKLHMIIDLPVLAGATDGMNHKDILVNY